MGMNFYLMTGKKHRETCSLGHVHLVPDRYHIGKSSCGRYFTLHALELEDGTRLDSLEAWKKFAKKWKKGWIENECGERIDPEEMWKTVSREGWAPRPGWEKKLGKPVETKGMPSWHISGHYDEWGEKGLVKTHGAETGEDGLYVLMHGDFS
jgi:hypothetical protein